jgi:hypothetical protein
VTYPLGPIAVPDLAGMVQATTPDGAVMRIGRVTAYAAGKITVNISDSDVLVDAAYLFSAYQPVLGDNVAVVKQGNQWLALGTPSANPDDNVVRNYSFENDDVGSTPSDWDHYNDPASTDTTLITVGSTTTPIDGPKVLQLELDNTVAGALSTSIDYHSSVAFPVIPGQFWSAHAWLLGFSFSSGPWVRGGGTVFFSFYDNPGNTYPNTVAPDAGLAEVNVPVSPPWLLVRSESGSGRGVEIPAGATHARVTLRTVMTHESTTSNYSFTAYWDRVVARQLS